MMWLSNTVGDFDFYLVTGDEVKRFMVFALFYAIFTRFWENQHFTYLFFVLKAYKSVKLMLQVYLKV